MKEATAGESGVAGPCRPSCECGNLSQLTRKSSACVDIDSSHVLSRFYIGNMAKDQYTPDIYSRF